MYRKRFLVSKNPYVDQNNVTVVQNWEFKKIWPCGPYMEVGVAIVGQYGVLKIARPVFLFLETHIHHLQPEDQHSKCNQNCRKVANFTS